MTAPLRLVSGSAADPSATFTADAATGLYLPTTSQLGLSVAGVLKLLLTTTGITPSVPINFQAVADVASATTTDIGAVASNTVRITGTTTITGLGTAAAGVERWILFEDALTLTHNGTSLILPGAADITTAASDMAYFKSEGSGNWRCYIYVRAAQVPIQAASTTVSGTVELATEAEAAARSDTSRVASVAVSPLLPGFLFGLTLSNNGTDATNDIDIAAGKARDSTDAVNMILAAGLTKQLDAAWAVGDDQGGLDTGSIADTTYHVWLIKRSDTGVVDVLFSASATAPTMPTNYDYKRRIGSIIRASGAIVLFTQSDDEFERVTPITSIAAAGPGTSAVTRALNVPTGVSVLAIVTHSVVDTSTTASTYGLLTSLAQSDVAPTAALHDISVPDSGASDSADSATRNIRTNTSGQIRSRLSASTGDHTEYIVVWGWIDTRGRLA